MSAAPAETKPNIQEFQRLTQEKQMGLQDQFITVLISRTMEGRIQSEADIEQLCTDFREAYRDQLDVNDVIEKAFAQIARQSQEIDSGNMMPHERGVVWTNDVLNYVKQAA